MPEIKKLPHSEIEVRISVAWDDWKGHIDQAVGDFAKEVNAKGFRPGKAPRKMVEQKVGKDAILELAAEKAIRHSYGDFLKNEKIEAIGQPRIELQKIAEGNDLEYKARTAVMPEAELSDWQAGVKKINAKFKKANPEVTEDEIDKEIGKLAQSRSKLITVNRPARKEDNVLVDFQVFQDGVPIENGSSLKHPLVLGSGVFIPGFEDQLIGLENGDEKEFELPFPKEYHAKNLAGKMASFKIKMREVQERQIPEINDDFAKSLGNFENLSALKKSVGEGMKKEKEKNDKEKHRGEITDKLVEKTEADLPRVLVDQETEKMIQEFESQIKGMGMDMEAYFGQIKKSPDDLKKEWRPQAEKRIKAALALGKLAEEAGITVPSETIEEEMNRALGMYRNIKDAEKNIDMGRLYEYVKGTLTNDKVFEYLEKL